MKKITLSLIFATSLPALFACSEPTNKERSAETATALTEQKQIARPTPETQPKANEPSLNLSLPDETTAHQKIHIPTEPPLMSEIFNQEKAPSKYQLKGQMLLNEEQKLGIEVFDGAEVSITIMK